MLTPCPREDIVGVKRVEVSLYVRHFPRGWISLWAVCN
jgi:hypothetical protein